MANRDVIYDYTIIGSGVAGNICAYELAKQGKKCLILEKNKERIEKVCGGGISYFVLDQLEQIGMKTEKLLSLECKRIYGDRFWIGNYVKEHEYGGKFSIGIRRKLLDDFLMTEALEIGCDIEFSENVREIRSSNGLYDINGHLSKKYVCAAGATGFRRQPGQSIGISGLLRGEIDLPDNRFYFWYAAETRDEYFWAFPVGVRLWNVGLWYKVPQNGLKQGFQRGIEKYIYPVVKNGYDWLKKPQSGFLGTVDLRKGEIIGIGDFAGTCSVKNGGGIHYAIESAIAYAASEKIL